MYIFSFFRSKSSEPHLQEYPMIVTYRNKHNHNSHSADIIKYHPLKSDVKDIFFYLTLRRDLLQLKPLTSIKII